MKSLKSSRSDRSGIITRIVQNYDCYLFLIPVFVIFLLTVVFPIVYSGTLSFFRYGIVGKPVFIGIRNYQRIIASSPFWVSLRNTVVMVAVIVPVGMLFSLSLATVLNRPLKGRSFCRLSFFIPYITTMVVVALIWKWMYSPNWGLINEMIGYLGFAPRNWLGDPKIAIFSVIFLMIWKNVGYNMILFLAGLQSIPNAYYEAARIDGAGSWAQFLYITVPLLRPIFLFIIVISTIGAFQVFDSIYVMTHGGPGYSTTTLAFSIYLNVFDRLRMGYGSAMSVILAIIIFILSYVELKYLRTEGT